MTTEAQIKNCILDSFFLYYLVVVFYGSALLSSTVRGAKERCCNCN